MEAAGEAVNQIPFNDLKVIIDVRFIILSGYVATLLSTKDLLSNGLDIRIQDCVITQGGKRQKLEMMYFFLVYRWQP